MTNNASSATCLLVLQVSERHCFGPHRSDQWIPWLNTTSLPPLVTDQHRTPVLRPHLSQQNNLKHSILCTNRRQIMPRTTYDYYSRNHEHILSFSLYRKLARCSLSPHCVLSNDLYTKVLELKHPLQNHVQSPRGTSITNRTYRGHSAFHTAKRTLKKYQRHEEHFLASRCFRL